MLGAGVFSALAPASRAAGAGLLIALAVAGFVAYCNATSSARLAARHPESGGTYVYGRRRLGPFWGYLAGWAFVVGKTASCAAVALTFASYAAPGHERLVGGPAVAALSLLACRGVQKGALLTRLIVAIVLTVLLAVVVVCLAGGTVRGDHLRPFPGASIRGILEGAGLFFFAFAGYARVATLGEEVRDPARAGDGSRPLPAICTQLRRPSTPGAGPAPSAATLSAARMRPPRWLPLAGVVGCALLAVSLPLASALAGVAVLAVGAGVYVAVNLRPGFRPG